MHYNWDTESIWLDYIKLDFYCFRICNDIEDIFTYCTLGQVLASLLVLASCMYNIAIVPITDPDMLSIISLIAAVLIQLAVFCYFGNEIALVVSISLYYNNIYKKQTL